jgi:hypothetical protein
MELTEPVHTVGGKRDMPDKKKRLGIRQSNPDTDVKVTNFLSAYVGNIGFALLLISAAALVQSWDKDKEITFSSD